MSKTKNLAAALRTDNARQSKTPLSSEPTGKPAYFGFRLDPAAKRQLEFLRLEIGAKNLQALMTEAVNDLFEKYKKDRIA